MSTMSHITITVTEARRLVDIIGDFVPEGLGDSALLVKLMEALDATQGEVYSSGDLGITESDMTITVKKEV